MRLIDADALLKTFAEKGIRYSVDMYNAIIDAKTPVVFICDGRACPSDCMECQHTTDITHAENFINKNGRYMEKVRTGRWIRTTTTESVCEEWTCTKCKGEVLLTTDYCPNCGAKMGAEE